MKCSHFMSHFLAINPISAEEKLEQLKIITNPFLLEDMQEYPEQLRDIAQWGEEEPLDIVKEFYEKLSQIQQARKKGGIINGD